MTRKVKIVATDEELAWVAGFFDGEGAVGIRHKLIKGDLSKQYWTESAILSNGHRPSLEKVQRLFGGCGVIKRSLKKNDTLSEPMYVWVVEASSARSFLTAILPFSIIKRQQIELALSVVEIKTTNPRTETGVKKRLSPETHQQIGIVKKTISKLNKHKIPPENYIARSARDLNDISSTTLAWLAGFFDGEGSIRIKCSKVASCTRSWVVFIRITNTHIASCNYGRDLLDLGSVCVSKARGMQTRPSAVWTVAARKAFDFLWLIRPYIFTKTEQVKLAYEAMDCLKNSPRVGYKISEVTHQKMEVYQAKIRNLNGHLPNRLKIVKAAA